MTFFPDQRGYSLIEIIVVIIVLGILMSVGLFGLQQAMDGYNLAQASATSTQKAQIALDRLTIELSHITYNSILESYNISTGTANSITYTANFGLDEDDEKNTIINLSGTQVLLKNFLLIDGVAANGQSFKYIKCDGTEDVTTNGLQFTYFDGNGNSVGATSTDMRLIGMALTVQVTATATRTYNARVALQQ